MARDGPAGRLRRDPDERLGVLLQGLGDWSRHADRAVNWEEGANVMRVHPAVDGSFPDDSFPTALPASTWASPRNVPVTAVRGVDTVQRRSARQPIDAA
jgi:hypothetical protein